MKRKTEEPGSVSAAVLAQLLRGDRQVGPEGAPVGRLTVLHADLRGFARATNRLNEEIVVRLLREFFSVMTDLAVAHRATIDKLTGTAIMLLFGLPMSRSDDPLRAVRAGLEMQQAFLALRNTWRRDGRRRGAAAGLRVGVSTGDVAIGAAETSEVAQYMAIGAPVDRAANFCRAARDAEVLIDSETYQALGQDLDDDVNFAAIEVQGRTIRQMAYRCQLQRARLHLVRRPVDDRV